MDSSWIENLGSVLDNSRLLRLMSGETIQLPPKMNLIFETADLNHVSPSMVIELLPKEPPHFRFLFFVCSFLSTFLSYLFNSGIEMLRYICEFGFREMGVFNIGLVARISSTRRRPSSKSH